MIKLLIIISSTISPTFCPRMATLSHKQISRRLEERSMIWLSVHVYSRINQLSMKPDVTHKFGSQISWRKVKSHRRSTLRLSRLESWAKRLVTLSKLLIATVRRQRKAIEGYALIMKRFRFQDMTANTDKINGTGVTKITISRIQITKKMAWNYASLQWSSSWMMKLMLTMQWKQIHWGSARYACIIAMAPSMWT